MSYRTPSEISAVILAGGKGTRLKPLTTVFPKPLVPLGEKTVIEILLRRLARFGFKKVTLCTGYHQELIMAVCGNGGQFGLEITYSHEDRPLGTAGPLAVIKGLTDPFIVMNGDLLTTLHIDKMLDYHVEQKADITIGIYSREVQIDFGVVEVNEKSEFIGLQEKPTYHFNVSMGINVLNRNVLRHLQPDKYLDMPDLIDAVHKTGGAIACYREDCYWLDIGRMEDYALAQKDYADNEKNFLKDD